MKKQNEIRQSWNSPRRNQEATQTVSTNNYQSNTSMVNDQSKVPSAMRSSFVLGVSIDVCPNNDKQIDYVLNYIIILKFLILYVENEIANLIENF